MTDAPGRIGVCYPKGFRAGGEAAGIKKSGAFDVAAVFSERPCSGAAVFTTNRVQSAGVQVSCRHLAAAAPRAVILSSGNANAATGEYGIRTAEEMCRAAANVFGIEPAEVLIGQTGLIGIPLDRSKAVAGAEAAARAAAIDGGETASRAIMTTDTVPKRSHYSYQSGTAEVRIGGMAKGAAMLSPAMATMLAVVATDAAVEPALLQEVLSAAMRGSFHSIVVDGCRSTNDTVILLANGASDAPLISSPEHPDFAAFSAGVQSVCRELAVQMVKDAEGATRHFSVTVLGARSDEDAHLAARTVVSSALVKCSIGGADPYWGRILSELGASGAVFEPEQVSISYGGITNCRNGEAAACDEQALLAYMQGREIEITADLGAGSGRATCHGCDLTHAYIDENSTTS